MIASCARGVPVLRCCRACVERAGARPVFDRSVVVQPYGVVPGLFRLVERWF